MEFEANIGNGLPIIMDLETFEVYKRKIVYDEESKSLKAKIKLKPYKKFISLNVTPQSNKSQDFDNLEIGKAYRDGTYNFPKDALKSAEYFEKDSTVDGLYFLASLFRTEEDLKDESVYKEYLNAAIEKGSELAKIEFDLNAYMEDSSAEEKERAQELLESLTSAIGKFIYGYFIENKLAQGDAQKAYDFYVQSAKESFKPACVRLGVETFNDEDNKIIKNRFMNNLSHARVASKAVSMYCMGCVLFNYGELTHRKREAIKLLQEAATLSDERAYMALMRIFKVDDDFKDDKSIFGSLDLPSEDMLDNIFVW